MIQGHVFPHRESPSWVTCFWWDGRWGEFPSSPFLVIFPALWLVAVIEPSVVSIWERRRGSLGRTFWNSGYLWGRTSQRRCWAGPQAWVPVLGPLILSRVVLVTGVILLCPKDSLHHNALLNCSGSSVGKEFACSTGDLDSISGWGRSPGKGNGNPFQYSCLENLMDRGAWWVIAHGVAWVGQHLATKPPNCPHGDILHMGLDGYSLSRSR